METTTRQQIVQRIQQRLDRIVAVYLFGSHADDTAQSGSDVDLAVLTARDAINPQIRWTMQEDLSIALGHDVDLVDLRSASTVMQMQIISGGRLLFESDPHSRHAFEMYVYANYALLNEERSAILKDIQERGRVYD